MSANLILVLSTVCAGLIAGSACAQDSRAGTVVGQLSDATLHITYEGSNPSGNWATEVYSRANLSGPTDGERFSRSFFARRYSITGSDRVLLAEVTVEECPALYGVLVGLEDFVAPRFELPSLQGFPPRGANLAFGVLPPPDSRTYTVRGWARQPDGSPAHMVVTASVGLLADLVGRAEANTASCWTAPTS